MSESEKKEHDCAAAEANQEELAAAVPQRRGHRRKGICIPGTSDPYVAKMFSMALQK